MLLSKKNMLGLRKNLKTAKIVARFEFFQTNIFVFSKQIFCVF